MSTDTLSDVLRAVRLTGAVYYSIESSSPWVAETPESRVIAPRLGLESEHVIEYHLIASGACWGGLLDEPAVRLQAGDVLAFPQGDAHVLSSAPGMRSPPVLEFFERPVGQSLPFALSAGGGGADRAHVVCGFLGLDARPFNPLLAALPRFIHQRSSTGQSSLFGSLVSVAVEESRQRNSGGECVLARLSELLFVDVVRRYVASLPAEQTGWLAALKHEIVGKALTLLHDRPTEDWSLDTLARQVAVSRSVLAERFAALVGIPPMAYLARWRMQLAAGLLTGTTASLAEISERVGYGSEAAFSRAFKKTVGVAPAFWRQGQRPSAALEPM